LQGGLEGAVQEPHPLCLHPSLELRQSGDVKPFAEVASIQVERLLGVPCVERALEEHRIA
jgi:hypothetical protein